MLRMCSQELMIQYQYIHARRHRALIQCRNYDLGDIPTVHEYVALLAQWIAAKFPPQCQVRVWEFSCEGFGLNSLIVAQLLAPHRLTPAAAPPAHRGHMHTKVLTDPR